MKITLKDKDYQLEWGMGALEIYCDNMHCDLLGLDMVLVPNREQNKAVVTLIAAAIENGLALQEPPQEMDVTYRQLQKFLDDAPQATLTKIMEDFRKSKYFGVTMEDYLLSTMGEEEETSAPKKKSD